MIDRTKNSSGLLKRLTGIPVYPFLLATFPVLFLFTHNIPQASLKDLWMPLLFSNALALILMLFFLLIYRKIHRAGLAASAILLLCLTYGHVAQFLRAQFHLKELIVGPLILLLYGLLFVIAFVLLSRMRNINPRVLIVLNATGAILVVMQFVAIVGASMQARVPIPDLKDSPLYGYDPNGNVSGKISKPDIYYIIPDRYPGRYALADVYGFDNSDFLDALKERGFLVLDDSRCNYPRTDMSLASSLNLCYINDAANDLSRRSLPRVLYHWNQDYHLWPYLDARGYRYLHFGTWWYVTSRNRNADVNYNRLILTEFSMMFYKTTVFYAFGTLLGWDSQGDQYHRELYKFGKLRQVAREPGPKYVFAHFLLPHEGFVFDRDGRFQTRLAQSRRQVNDNFVAQLEFANEELLRVIDTILANSTVQPVIILQSDEGPRPGDNFAGADEVSTWYARYSILNAILLPGAEDDLGFSTPVNTFRIVLNRVFGEDFRLLSEESYSYEDGQFRDVTAFLDSCGVAVKEGLQERFRASQDHRRPDNLIAPGQAD